MSELQPDSAEAFERLLSEQTSYINEVDKEIAKWKQHQNDYQQLRTRLSTLPDRLTYESMVPFGKLAFLPGRIIHSNEILVLLGDNYFVERSCKQAIEIVDRRLGNISDKLNQHQKEKEIFNKQKNYTSNFLDDRTKFFEIKETEDDYNNTQEKKSTINRRAKLTEEQIREERRKLQERAKKLNEPKAKRVHFADDKMDVDSDDDDIPHKQFKKIYIHHTKTDPTLIGDPSPAVFPHPGAIGLNQPSAIDSNQLDITEMNQPSNISSNEPVAFTGKAVERPDPIGSTTTVDPPKRISKFKASRQ